MRTPLRNDCAALLRSLLEELCSNRRLVAVGSSGWRRAAIGRGSWLASPCRQDNGGNVQWQGEKEMNEEMTKERRRRRGKETCCFLGDYGHDDSKV